MKCNLIIQLNQLTVRDYTIIEDEGLIHMVGAYPKLTHCYEDDEETGKHVIVITAPDLPAIFEFLDFIELPVRILT